MTRSSLPDARSPRPIARLARRQGGWAALLSALALVVGCGGGGSDGTATAAAFTQGTINGFGSVIVNGIRFADTSAAVYDDAGTRQSLGVLRLGMRVTVDSGAIDAGSASAHASSFRYGGQALGPVTAVDTTASSFTVLGQVVDVTSGNVFDDSLSGGLSALATALAAGSVVVEVHGLPDAATGHIVATGATTTFSPSGKTAADLIVGATVRVKGSVGSTRTQVKASEISFTTSTSS